MKKVLITGSSGLVGSECLDFFHKKKFKIYALDNDYRSKFFGKASSTIKVKKFQKASFKNVKFINKNLLNYTFLEDFFKNNKFDLIIHAAAQPSHDWSAQDPILDYKVNALATIYLLDLTRKYSPKAVFIFSSTNKVYGDRPNSLKGLKELKKRYEVFNKGKLFSIDEEMSIDNSMHSPFGASKISADISVQEYGKYFGIKTGIFRCGCITGPNHQGAELHGFLSYLVKCIIQNKNYNVYGYKGKQVRDNIHSKDLTNMFWQFYLNPGYGEVYNAGGGRNNSISILEAIDTINDLANLKWNKFQVQKEARSGDHIWYVTDFKKFKKKYPSWNLEHSNELIIEQIIKKFRSEIK
tara:strand:+ start:95 stop:1153 length:1059 start_codon:yes stop_codon:yes gene_type:complete